MKTIYVLADKDDGTIVKASTSMVTIAQAALDYIAKSMDDWDDFRDELGFTSDAHVICNVVAGLETYLTAVHLYIECFYE